MGRYIKGIGGPFVGRIGTVIGSSRFGIPYMKGVYKNRTTVISEKEQFNRRVFAKTQFWLKPLTEFLRVGFRGYSERSQGFISAKSYLYKNALKIEGDNITIDPALVKVSYGDLPVSDDTAVSRTGPNELTFTWNPDGLDSSHDKDQVMMLAYNIDTGKRFYILTGQFRTAGQDILPMKLDLFPGEVLHVYIAFIAADRSRQSDSVYLGEVVI